MRTCVFCDFDIALDASDLEEGKNALVEDLLGISLASMRIEDHTNAFESHIVLWNKYKIWQLLNSTIGPRQF